MMRRKGIFTLLTAVCMVLAFSAVSFAANQVFLKTTVPNIPKSECYQAGSITMELDSGTQMSVGDVIQFTLNNKTTVCKDLNMFLRITDTTLLDDVSIATAPVTSTAGSVTDPGTGSWGFLIRATNADTVAGQIITMTLQRRDLNGLGAVIPGAATMVFTAVNPADKMVIKLFDGKTGALAARSVFLKPSTTATLYDTIIVPSDNALCIDTLTQNFPDEYVQATPDSIPLSPADRLNFSGDYRIAHILSELTYTLVTCKGANCGTILIGSSGQTSSSCSAFDFESTLGYCTGSAFTNLHTPSRFILQSSQPYEPTAYTVKMEILVNGLAGEHGVYWSSTVPQYGNFTTAAAACSNGAAGAFTPTYLRGDGTTVAVPVSAAITSCSGIAAGAKAVTITTASQNLFVLGDSYLWIDFPPLVYNLAEIQSGDAVTVRVTLSKSTCGIVNVSTICIGTFGCTSRPVTISNSLTFPYFTSLSAGDFWNGIVVTNLGAAAGNATFTAYEKDGSSGTATAAVGANSMFVDLLENMTWTGTGLGGQPLYIVVTTDFNADGFAMMANDSHDSMGYLPRK
jgi:hypothetical protein